MKRMAFMAAATAFAILLAESRGSADIKVTPEGHLFTPTQAQQAEVFNLLSQIHGPPGAQRLLPTVIYVDPKGATELVVTVTEDMPGEILPCQVIAVLGGFAQGDAETLDGDGSYNGPPTTVLQSSFGTVLDFSGTPSTHDPLKIHIDLTFAPR